MRILHVIGSLDPAGGGPPAVVMRLAASQAALEQEVRVASYDEPGAVGALNQELANIPHANRVVIERIPAGGRVERLLALRAKKALREAAARADVVHIHGVWGAMLRAGACAAKEVGVHYCIAPHGMLDPWSLRQKALKKKLALLAGYRRMLNDAAFLHVLNADEQRLLAPLGLRPPCEVIPNGVFIEEFDGLPPGEAFYARHPQVRRGPFILFLSRLHYKKGLDYLADAFSLCARRNGEVQLVVAGPDGGARSEFEGRIAAAGVADRVHLVGPLYGQEKLAALAAASCFCLPSRQEGFSVAIVEAMACGVPAVVSEECHFPEVAEVGAGRVVALDAQRLAEAMLEIVSDGAMRERMGRAGRELVAERFTWPMIAKKAVEVYREAIARKDLGA